MVCIDSDHPTCRFILLKAPRWNNRLSCGIGVLDTPASRLLLTCMQRHESRDSLFFLQLAHHALLVVKENKRGLRAAEDFLSACITTQLTNGSNELFHGAHSFKHKSDTLTKIKHFKAMIELQTSHQIKAIRSDNGGKYVSMISSSFVMHLEYYANLRRHTLLIRME